MAVGYEYEADRMPARLWIVPIATTALGSAVALTPIVVQVPVVPPFGLLVALAWRLLRPEMWGAWMALPLGLIDDLIGGAPLGTAMTLWTIAFLAIEIAEQRVVWRDVWLSWRLAIGAIAFCVIGAWGLAFLAGGAGPIWLIVPQLLLSILCFPGVMRLVAVMDRWRLGERAANSR
ncbi:rod shape-determining protein MreD [Sphingomonas vulcanisoli]|uniref:Rod shape-determining protein MreD n=1 Tax=Sphingomonas vulcanisoli TaxID=1658060 RepID=A0ABX0TRB6_9SPHN|nr:rod shape-determining protein MreD [Sphingomonas vulcanisoli]NIJ07623.1 rod shape-determining protein MreD [Sphingomonas vulcanisoli]